MKILSVLGSPRKEGHTAQLLEKYLKGVQAAHENVELTTVYPTIEDIRPCMGCNACKGGSPKACIIDDDMKKYYQPLNEADVIILATPVYWFNLSSQLKVFIDRMYGLDLKNFSSGKKLVLLMAYGDNDMISSGAVNISNSLKQMAKFLGMTFELEYGVSSNQSKEKEMDTLQEIERLGTQLNLES